MYPHHVYWNNYWRLYCRTSSHYYFGLNYAARHFFQLRRLSCRPNMKLNFSWLYAPKPNLLFKMFCSVYLHKYHTATLPHIFKISLFFHTQNLLISSLLQAQLCQVFLPQILFCRGNQLISSLLNGNYWRSVMNFSIFSLQKWI